MRKSDIEAVIAEWDKNLEFSGVISVTVGDTPLFEQAYGFANRADEIKNTADTRFAIASGCKGFAAVAVCQLMERGLLSPGTRLCDCLGGMFPGFDKTITVHHLLTHTSGIPDYFDEETMDDFEALWRELPMYAMREPADFVPLFRDKPMKFAPGSRFSYSNSGFIALGLIVAQASGQAFTSYVEDNVFKPAGMDNSGYFPMDQLPARTAYGYVRNADGSHRTNIYGVPIVGGPDGGAYTTVRDMARFWDALLGHRLLGEKMTRTLLHPGVEAVSEGGRIWYGYGVYIIVKDDQVQAYYLCGGGDPGVDFLSVVYPTQRVIYTAVGNTNMDTWPLLHGFGKLVTAGSG